MTTSLQLGEQSVDTRRATAPMIGAHTQDDTIRAREAHGIGHRNAAHAHMHGQEHDGRFWRAWEGEFQLRRGRARARSHPETAGRIPAGNAKAEC
ncbi:hypothetical protein [Bordetella genomosp. 1]|uniref:Uncharacterized protein n=1 Tax=Bordetella genomosp. 1 TaxID=1395607 RepID=A0ABX4EZR3_9BORD|nr:hypothetical protein [Bordetella genomosp. 1]OZI65241.1 hypothetical protein CAL27_09320 [Bordetella genomosp. 1]